MFISLQAILQAVSEAEDGNFAAFRALVKIQAQQRVVGPRAKPQNVTPVVTRAVINDPVDGAKNTMLHLAVRVADYESVAYLLMRGADILAVNDAKETPSDVGNKIRAISQAQYDQLVLIKKAISTNAYLRLRDNVGLIEQLSRHIENFRVTLKKGIAETGYQPLLTDALIAGCFASALVIAQSRFYDRREIMNEVSNVLADQRVSADQKAVIYRNFLAPFYKLMFFRADSAAFLVDLRETFIHLPKYINFTPEFIAAFQPHNVDSQYVLSLLAVAPNLRNLKMPRYNPYGNGGDAPQVFVSLAVYAMQRNLIDVFAQVVDENTDLFTKINEYDQRTVLDVALDNPQAKEAIDKIPAFRLLIAIRHGDLAALKANMYPGALAKVYGANRENLLAYAVRYNQGSIIKYLLECGFSVDTRFANGQTVFDLCQNTPYGRKQREVLVNYKAFSTNIDAKLTELRQQWMAQLAVLQPPIMPQKKNLIDAVIAGLNGVDFRTLTVGAKLDVQALLVGLLDALKNANGNVRTLNEFVKTVFALRENFILETDQDYSSQPSSVANQLCHRVAAAMFCDAQAVVQAKAALVDSKEDKDAKTAHAKLAQAEEAQAVAVSHVLLDVSRTKHRPAHDPVWIDPVMQSDELPAADQFMRVGNNEMHLYDGIVSRAVNELKAGNFTLKTVWFGTDTRNSPPQTVKDAKDKNKLQLLPGKPLPLSAEALVLLSQRSPTLGQLIDYTKDLDRCSRLSGCFYAKFVALRQGMLEGDVGHDGSEYEAGKAGNIAIAEFSEWWWALDANARAQIRQLGNGGIGSVLDAVFSQNINNRQGRDIDVNYCLYLKGQMLGRALASSGVSYALQNMGAGNAIMQRVRKADQQLDVMYTQIMHELKSEPKLMFCSSGVDVFRQRDTIQALQRENQLDYTSLMLLANLKNNKYADANKLLDYIFSTTSNDRLLNLRRHLSMRGEFDYLRKHGWFSRFYGVVEGACAQTSRTWATLEKAFAVQIMKNANQQGLAHRKQELTKLVAENNFIGNCRKHKLHFFASDTAKMADMDKGALADYAEREIEKIKKVQVGG